MSYRTKEMSVRNRYLKNNQRIRVMTQFVEIYSSVPRMVHNPTAVYNQTTVHKLITRGSITR